MVYSKIVLNCNFKDAFIHSCKNKIIKIYYLLDYILSVLGYRWHEYLIVVPFHPYRLFRLTKTGKYYKVGEENDGCV